MLFLMMIRLTRRVKVSVQLFRKTMSGILVFGRMVSAKINGNAFFATPAVPLATLDTALDELETAINDAYQGGQLETAVMYQKREVVEDLLTQEAQYVEGVANDATNTGNGDAVVLSAGMSVKRFTPRAPQVFAAKNTEFPGVVLVTAPSVERGSHQWQHTLTPADESSWTSVPDTTKAHTFITGFNVGEEVYFRHRALLSSGYTPWASPISILIR